MRIWFRDNDRLKTVSQYIAAAILSALILCFLLKLWRADLKVPFHYNGDALLHAMFIKGIVDNGWYWQNPSIGAPNGLQMYDFPAVDNSAAVIFAFIGLLTKNPFLVMNIFYLLTFPLVTISSLYVFRRLKLSYVIALFASLLYTFLPYHFMRGESHLFLSAYYFVPLVVLVLLWLTSDQLSDGRGRFGLNLRSRNFILSIVICFLIGSTGVYYPFFACFLLIVAGISAVVVRRSWRPLLPTAILVGFTFAVVIVNHSPSMIYLYRHGDAGVTQRSLAGPEIYSLKISQLLLPITGHRIGRVAHIKELYNQNTVFTESDAAALGVVGSIGFLVLLGQLFYRKAARATDRNAMLADLSILNLFAVLLATVGGIGSLFALFVSPALRSYNRISVFIAFFSLLAVAVGLEWLYDKRVKTARAQLVFYVLVAFVFVGAILDQTSKSYVPQYEQIKAEFESDARFVSLIEFWLPKDDDLMMFQLPYVPFPENPRINKMVDYDHLRAYLHSRRLRWSYGAMKNRPGDLWQRQIATLPVEEMVKSLAFAGFSGVYVDRNGYDDDGAAAIEAQLGRALKIGPTVSHNGRLVFFNARDENWRLRQQYSEEEWQKKKELTLNPLMLDWVGGFSGLEAYLEKTWRWCSNEGELHINNPSQLTRRISLEMKFATGHEQFDDLSISGSLISEAIKVNATPSSYSRTVTVPPGKSVIKFASNAKRVDAPLDPRVLIFRIEDFKMKELE